MASSSKVQFHLDTLKSKALESIDARIASARTHVASFTDEAAMEALLVEWRERQEARISDVFRQLETIRDRDLAKFKVEPLPEHDDWERRKAVGHLRDLEDQRTQIVAKADSLVADEAGNISLTKTQLSEFFGL